MRSFTDRGGEVLFFWALGLGQLVQSAAHKGWYVGTKELVICLAVMIQKVLGEFDPEELLSSMMQRVPPVDIYHDFMMDNESTEFMCKKDAEEFEK